MLLMRIFYAILMIVCILFYIMYLWDFAFILLIVLVAVPVVFFFLTLIAKRCIDVEFTAKSDTVMKNESFPVMIKIINKSFLPIGRGEAHIEYCNVFSGESDNFSMYLPIQPRNEQSVVFQLRSGFCGVAEIICDKIYIYDPMKLFRFAIVKNSRVKIAVMPECREITGTVVITDKVMEESDIFSEHKAGDDPSEIFDLRGFNYGDKLNRIHWKLSTKKDEFIVKDYSLPIDVPCQIFLDLKRFKDNQFTLPVFDTMIEACVSISQFMIENERLHNIVYFNHKRGIFEERRINDDESLAVVIRELIFSLDSKNECQSADHYFVENSGISLSSLVFITSDLNQSALVYVDDEIDADIKNVVVVVDSENSKIPDKFANINIIPVVMGKITSSIKDIEV